MKYIFAFILSLSFSGYILAADGEVKTEIQKLPWEQEISGKRVPMEDVFVRESDVMWYKNVWRVLDCREKINLHFKWPKKPFIGILLDAIKSGKRTSVLWLR
jgi:hypothetical protein